MSKRTHIALLPLLAALMALALCGPALGAQTRTVVITAEVSTMQLEGGGLAIDPGSPVAVQARVTGRDGRTVTRWLGGRKAVEALVAAGWFKRAKTSKGYAVYVAQRPYLDRMRHEEQLGLSTGNAAPGPLPPPGMPPDPDAMPGDDLFGTRRGSGLTGGFSDNNPLGEDLSPLPPAKAPGNVMGLPDVLYKKIEREREQEKELSQPGGSGGMKP